MARYITTTLPYVNAEPHIGFALEIVQADAVARAHRLQGEEVFFSTGTDEHGQKIFEAAEKAGQSVEEYVDHFVARVESLKEPLALSVDGFIRTTATSHIEAAQEMWRRCEAAGDIYKKSYSGLYCVGCEAYKTEKDLDETGHCLVHPSLTLETLTEENYFFRFSKYQGALLSYLSNKHSVIPDWRREEAISFVQSGLEDFSISRESSRLSWGVPVPGDDTQVMYVWFDALTSYISTLGWPEDKGALFKKFWTNGHTLQMAGKDQVRFQSLMWQAMLFSAGLKNTDQVFYHGFINSGGQRMSKSLGNVISPYDLVEKYGTDAARYILLRHVHPTEDTDITWDRLDEWYTANMVNGLGNLVARVMKLSEEYLSPVELSTDDTMPERLFMDHLESFRFNDAMDHLFEHIARGDQFMTDHEPYKKIKSDDPEVQESARADIERLVRHIAKIAAHLSPVLPSTSVAILTAIKENKKPENLFPRLTA